VSDPGPCRDAERRLAELLSILESDSLDARALEIAGDRVAAALARLSRQSAPAELARVLDLHACVREAAGMRRVETGEALRRTQADRERISHLTRPSDSAGSLDVQA